MEKRYREGLDGRAGFGGTGVCTRVCVDVRFVFE
jgi:hypothetical protein